MVKQTNRQMDKQRDSIAVISLSQPTYAGNTQLLVQINRIKVEHNINNALFSDLLSGFSLLTRYMIANPQDI